jgi:transketolase
MGAIANGMALYGCIRPYTATFLVFADYMRPAIRMAALMKLPVIYIFSHDSFWVGEDGPTHQPIEQVASLRVIPNLHVYRPGSGMETAVAWDMALQRTDGPTALILTRQKLPRFAPPDTFKLDQAQKGAYLAGESEDGDSRNILVASGSEVSTCIEAQKLLQEEGISVRVVSMLCREVFSAQSEEYQQEVIPAEAENVFWIEAGYEPSGYCFTRGKGTVIGLSDFGTSAPGKVLADHFGFTPEKIAQKVRNLLA